MDGDCSRVIWTLPKVVAGETASSVYQSQLKSPFDCKN
ncbi:MAG: hypothetical protein OFPI_34690 [Osedax symbiont Rs2]|nr:MAG: hypothetical protein OFPI_34690 [Osedax symbiont Rs2]